MLRQHCASFVKMDCSRSVRLVVGTVRLRMMWTAGRQCTNRPAYPLSDRIGPSLDLVGVEEFMNKKQDSKRRDFLKKAAYSAPAILTLQAASGVAKAGSEKPATETTEPKLPKPSKPKN